MIQLWFTRFIKESKEGILIEEIFDYGILVLDSEDSILFINSTAERFLGIKAEEVVNQNLWQTIVSSEVLLALTSHKSDQVFSFYHKGDTVLMKGQAFTNAGTMNGTIWILQKSASDSGTPLQEQETVEQELNAIIESVSDGIYVTDGEGITLRVNSAFQQITGIKAEDVVGKHVEELVERDIFRKSATVSVLKEKKQVSMVEDLKIGKEVLLTGTPVYNERNKIFRVVTTLQDVNSLNGLRKQLAASQEKTKLYEKELFQFRLQQMDMENIVIVSRPMREIVQMAMRLGEVSSNVLITGESGVGKDIIAKIIHKTGCGEDSPLITCNCGAIPESLIESELFGYEGGAFTGAKKEGSPGLFELSLGGTLFLDEIGELPYSFQTKFLRAIQEREIKRVGGNKPIKLDFRLIAATNRNLEEMVRDKLFRSDLYYRLNVVPLYIPPLRDRGESIVSFVYKFLDSYNRQFGRNIQISPAALQMLEDYQWPGNVRELKNTIERLVVLAMGDVIQPNDLPRNIRGTQPEETSGRIIVPDIMPLKKAVDELEFQLLSRTYEKYPSTRKVARILGISQSQVSRKLGKHNLYSPEKSPL